MMRVRDNIWAGRFVGYTRRWARWRDHSGKAVRSWRPDADRNQLALVIEAAEQRLGDEWWPIQRHGVDVDGSNYDFFWALITYPAELLKLVRSAVEAVER